MRGRTHTPVRSWRTILLLPLLSLALAMPLAPVAAQLPSTVFVYDRQNDPFDNNAEGYIWQQMGLLEANGRPGTVQANGDITDSQGKKLGSAIKDTGGNVIGYRSADGTKEAYNVSGGATTNQAWQRVANGGELHIIKHGSGYIDDDGGSHNGGGVQLDGGILRDGFKEAGTEGGGTGVGFGEPYPLDPRPGAGITINVNSCWSSNDPDGAGSATSVTGSAGAVTGVGATKGHTVKVNSNVGIGLSGTAKQVADATERLRAAAAAAGFKNADGITGPDEIAAWIASLPFATRYATLENTIKGTGATLKLAYSKQEQGPGPGGGTCVHADPTRIPDSIHVPVTYTLADPVFMMPVVSIGVEPGDLVAPAVFHITQLGQLPAPLPPSMVLASGVFDLRFNGIPPALAQPVDVRVSTWNLGTPSMPFLYDGVSWQPIPEFQMQGYAVMARMANLGIVALLTPGQVQPYTMADAMQALQVCAGLALVLPDRLGWLDVESGGASGGCITLEDTVRIARKAMGVDPNP